MSLLERLRIFKAFPEEDRRTAAAAPGTLVHVGERRTEQVTFSIFDYCENDFREATSASLQECLREDHEDTPTWMQVHGLHDTAAIGELLTNYKIHPLLQEDILNTRHRPKLEHLGDYTFIAVKEIMLDPLDQDIEMRHLSILVTPRVVITFQEEPSTLFAPLEDRLRQGKGVIRKRGPHYLTWAILDAVTDNYRIALDAIAEGLDDLDDAIANKPARYETETLHDLKREMEHLDRSVRPMREIASAMARLDQNPDNAVFWSDLQDHALHATESAEILRETVRDLRELLLDTLTRRMSEIMRVLTSYATIFMPLTFLAGVYGMNFKHMPELDKHWTYPAIWVVFAGIGVAMFIYFRRKRWL